MAMRVMIMFELTAKVYLADFNEAAIVSSELATLWRQVIEEWQWNKKYEPTRSMNHQIIISCLLSSLQIFSSFLFLQ